MLPFLRFFNRSFSRFISLSPDIITKIRIHASPIKKFANAETFKLLVSHKQKCASIGKNQLKSAVHKFYLSKVTSPSTTFLLGNLPITLCLGRPAYNTRCCFLLFRILHTFLQIEFFLDCSKSEPLQASNKAYDR